MPTRESLEAVLPVGSKVLSGGNRSWFRIAKYSHRGISIASTLSKKTALLRFKKLEIVLDNFHCIETSSIQHSIMELMKQHGSDWTQNETFLYGLAREYRIRTGLADLSAVHAEFERQVLECAEMNATQRRSLLEGGAVKPKKIEVRATVFVRNPAVVVEVLMRASGRCESCLKQAPFQRRSDGSPYLEVHHRTPLSEGGYDTVENAIALCPNCHRREHYA